jgi:hypothetical protein
MSEAESIPQSAEPLPPADRPLQKMNRGEEVTSVLLCLAWLILPTIQYFATAQRTGLQLGEDVPAPGLVNLDLTPGYAVLLALTFCFAGLRYFRTRKADSLEPASR